MFWDVIPHVSTCHDFMSCYKLSVCMVYCTQIAGYKSYAADALNGAISYEFAFAYLWMDAYSAHRWDIEHCFAESWSYFISTYIFIY